MQVFIHVQCSHEDKVGTFLRDVETKRLISPVLRDLVELYAWMRDNGWTSDNSRTWGAKRLNA